MMSIDQFTPAGPSADRCKSRQTGSRRNAEGDNASPGPTGTYPVAAIPHAAFAVSHAVGSPPRYRGNARNETAGFPKRQPAGFSGMLTAVVSLSWACSPDR